MENQVFIPAASLNDLYVSAIFITNTGEYRPNLKHQVLLSSLLLLRDPLQFSGLFWVFSAMPQQHSRRLEKQHFPRDVSSSKDG